jgi:hypothetical protein
LLQMVRTVTSCPPEPAAAAPAMPMPVVVSAQATLS